jgi:serpin B
VNKLRALRGAVLGALLIGWAALPGIARADGFPGGPTPDPRALTPYGVAAEGGIAFTFDLYARLKDANGGGEKNLFFSPYSISSAMAMTRLGARGPTAEEMSGSLRLAAEVPAIESSFAALNQSLTGDVAKQGYTLSVANALWGQRGKPFLADYLDVVKKDFGADLTPVDFVAQPEAVRKQINDWVANKTQDKIKDLLAPGSVTSDDQLILTNAIYFKGKWNVPFDAKQTSKADFYTLPGQPVKADMMHGNEHLLYAEDDLCQAVELPYKGDQMEMLVLLPKADIPAGAEDGTKTNEINTGMVRLESALNPNYLDKITGQLADRTVNLALPKWEATQEFMLGDVLQAMGMKLAFSPGAADFSGIDGSKDLALAAVIHKAYVKVDEEGTEAAGATAVFMFGAAVHAAPPPVNFTANHAFVYFIIHKPTHAILFAGRLADPTPQN